ncbi:MAG: hypothetical protein ACREPI_12370 [Candidatus Dormibacterales bacterium]
MNVAEKTALEELRRRFPEMDEAARMRTLAHVAGGADIEEAVAVETVLREMLGAYNP